ncbi:hypothetical protein RK21_00601 [Pseudomonas plecoglossicida]|nr:hypothetical protein RK21_00601 [Pseudomonas plecoglossicida]
MPLHLASSRVNPLLQDCIKAGCCAVPVGAGLPAKRPSQAAENRQICDNRPTFRMPIMKKQAHLHH